MFECIYKLKSFVIFFSVPDGRDTPPGCSIAGYGLAGVRLAGDQQDELGDRPHQIARRLLVFAGELDCHGADESILAAFHFRDSSHWPLVSGALFVSDENQIIDRDATLPDLPFVTLG